MPTKPVILALLVAIAIVLASTWLLRPPSTSDATGPQPVLDVGAASIVSLEVRGGDAGLQRVERASFGWLYLTDGAPPWAVQEGRARAATRILSDLQGRPVEDDPELAPIEATLVIEDARGRSISLGLREPMIGGRRVIDRVDSDGTVQRFAIDEPLYEAFVGTGLAQWRDEGVLGTLPGRAARIELARGESRLDLARVEGTWSVRAPIATRADASAINDLLEALVRMRVERFDEPPPPMVGAQDPVRITIEATVTTPGDADTPPQRAVERLVLVLNGAADTSGRLTLVGATRQREPRAAGATIEDLGTTYVAIDLEPLQQVALEPRGYVAKTALEGDASLIASLTLNDRTYVRTGTGWAEGERAVPDDRAAALDALAVLLAEKDMSGVELTDQPQPLGRPSAPVSIVARTITGEAIEPAGGVSVVVIDNPGAAAGVLVVGGGGTREYLDEESLAVGRATLVLGQSESGPAEPQPGDQ